jgi:curli biogenesis system outer membrane secretion channel CsgG
MEIPVCTQRLGAVSIVEPDNNWWQRFDLDSPEAVLNVIILRSGCFTIVDRNRGLRSRNLERALADNGDLQPGSNFGGGQVRAADYFMIPDIISTNRNSSGTRVGGGIGGILGRTLGGIAGGVNIRRREANVSLTLVNARTTETERISEGYYRKTDTGFGAGLFGGGGIFGRLGGGLGIDTYQNTEIGQVIVVAYIQAYRDLVTQLGGLPADASQAAPPAQ